MKLSAVYLNTKHSYSSSINIFYKKMLIIIMGNRVGCLGQNWKPVVSLQSWSTAGVELRRLHIFVQPVSQTNHDRCSTRALSLQVHYMYDRCPTRALSLQIHYMHDRCSTRALSLQVHYMHDRCPVPAGPLHARYVPYTCLVSADPLHVLR